MAVNLAGSSEAIGNFALLANPKAASDAEIGAFVDGVYHNLFARSVDAEGLSYWTGEIKTLIAADKSLSSVVVSIIGGAQNQQSHQDITALMNKVMVSFEYINEQADFDTQWSSAQLEGAIDLVSAVSADQQSALMGIKNADELAFQGA